MSAIFKDMTALVDLVEVGGTTGGGGKMGGAKSALMNPEKLESFLLEEEAPQVNVVYISEPDEAR